MPIVVFGDEGGVHIMAQHIVKLLQLLTCDKRIAASYNGVSYKDSGSLYASSYRDWVNEQFNISAIDNPLPIIQNAQDAFKASFDAWLTQKICQRNQRNNTSIITPYYLSWSEDTRNQQFYCIYLNIFIL